jgi:hypothetical protein
MQYHNFMKTMELTNWNNIKNKTLKIPMSSNEFCGISLLQKSFKIKTINTLLIFIYLTLMLHYLGFDGISMSIVSHFNFL